MKWFKNKNVKKHITQTMKGCQEIGGVFMAVETLYPTFESDLSVKEDIKTFMACSISHDILWEGKVGPRGAGVA